MVKLCTLIICIITLFQIFPPESRGVCCPCIYSEEANFRFLCAVDANPFWYLDFTWQMQSMHCVLHAVFVNIVCNCSSHPFEVCPYYSAYIAVVAPGDHRLCCPRDLHCPKGQFFQYSSSEPPDTAKILNFRELQISALAMSQNHYRAAEPILSPFSLTNSWKRSMVSSCRLGSYFVILVLHSIAAAVLVVVLFTSNLPYNFIVPMLEDLSIFLHSTLLFFDIGCASLCYCLLGFVIMTHFALGVFPKTWFKLFVVWFLACMTQSISMLMS